MMSNLMQNPPEQALKTLEKYVSNLEENILCTIALQPTMAPAKAKNLIAKTAETYALKNILEALKQLLQEEGKKYGDYTFSTTASTQQENGSTA